MVVARDLLSHSPVHIGTWKVGMEYTNKRRSSEKRQNPKFNLIMVMDERSYRNLHDLVSRSLNDSVSISRSELCEASERA
jgi:hypothetical protein